MHPLISIIIPVYNEPPSLLKLIDHIHASIGNVKYEIIIADGGDQNNTYTLQQRDNTRIIRSAKGRAVQMNTGAREAKGEILYFLHADTFPPAKFGEIINNYFHKGFTAGCFRLKFDLDHVILNFSGWASRFNVSNWQFGDQSLFVKRELFNSIGGFNEHLLIMEDVDAAARIRKKGKFIVMPYNVITSARKYRAHGVFRTEFTHFVVYVMHLSRMKQTSIARVYKKMLGKPKEHA